MIKYICDICIKEIKSGEFTAEFRSLEYDLTGKSKSPVISTYLMCNACSKLIKQEIAKLINKPK